jgi:hypothetical protein
VAEVTRCGESSATADLEFLDEQNRLIARMAGYECTLDAGLLRTFRRNRVAKESPPTVAK